MMKKLNSSALIIALIVGIVLSGTLVGVVLTLGQYSKSSGQAREGKIAYRAALSGVEDGLLRFKYALSQNKVSSLYGTQNDLEILKDDENSVDILYDLTFKMDSISVGTKLGGANVDIQNWKDNADNAIVQKAWPVLSDEMIDIDLTYLFNIAPKKLGSIEIFYSNPFVKNDDGKYTQGPFEGLSPKPFSAVAVKITNISNLGEEQMIFEKINNNRVTSKIQVGNIAECKGGSNTKQCHLQIKPQIAYTENAVDRTANRLSGEGIEAVASANKYVFFKIRAKDTNGRLIESTDDNPGTFTVESVGKAGEAVRTIQAKIDASGKYIGLLDFGIYCGNKCNMPSVRRTE